MTESISVYDLLQEDAQSDLEWGSASEFLQEIATVGESVQVATWRLLFWFRQERRGTVINRRIKNAVAQAGLVMQPDISDADYYGSISLSREDGTTAGEDAIEATDKQSLQSARNSASARTSWLLSSLKPDGAELVSLHYGDSLDVAIKRMREGGFDQMPLFFDMDSHSHLLGTVYLADLLELEALDSGKLIEFVNVDNMQVATNDRLMDCIPTILEKRFVYGRDTDGNVVQIYTIEDVAKFLYSVTEMFVRANEVEEMLRGILRSIDSDYLRQCRDSVGSLQHIVLNAQGDTLTDEEIRPRGVPDEQQHSADSFMFSDYMKAMGHDEIWENLTGQLAGVNLDKDACIRSLNDARLQRNEVMHFRNPADMTDGKRYFDATVAWLARIENAQ